MKRIWELISTASHSRTTALLVILVIGAAIPLTVLVAQKQQEVRQQASEGNNCGNQNCTGDTTCIRMAPNIETTFCTPKNSRPEGSYCGTPSSTTANVLFPILPNGDACESKYCDFNLRCTSPPESGGGNTGGTGGTAPGGTSTGGTCNPTYGAWFPQSCGVQGIFQKCAANQRYYTRSISNTTGCNDYAKNLEKCELDSTCGSGGGTCTDADYGPWNDAGCGNGGVFKDCNVNEMYQTRSIASGKGCNLNTRDMERCVPNSTCGGTTPQCNENTDNLRCSSSGSQVQQCQGGTWKTVSDCASFGQVCKAITGTVAACSSATPQTPTCDTGIQCTGACTAPANTCGAANGAESGCQFTALAGGGTCNRTSAPDRSCAIDKCVSPNTCSDGVCKPTPEGIHVNLSYSVGLDGIGSTGDRVNPSNNSLSIKTPQRTAKASILYVSGEPLANPAERQTTLHYDPSSGKYIGKVTNFLWSSTPGTFTIKIGTVGHLVKTVHPSINISDGQTIDISADLVAGDINNDNQLSILDYNMLIGCFGLIGQNTDLACKEADLNDDGTIDQFDYNLWLREFKAGPREGD